MENIPVKNQDFYAWPYEEQTKIKHQVLKEYFKVWITKLGYKSNTLFFDCHGGCGAYIENDNLFYGSSIIVDQTSQPITSQRKYKNGIIVCETDKDFLYNLQKVVKYSKPKSKFTFFNKDFNEVITDSNIILWYEEYPTLFFIDPFGFDLKMSNLKNLLNSFGNELIINYMFDYINRFIELPNLEKTIAGFYGCLEWKNAFSLSGKTRENFLVNLYKQQLKNYTKAKHVFAYRLCYPNKDRTYYYLFHVTNSTDGLSIMKSCFAHINNGKVEYLGKRNDNYSLFALNSFVLNEAEVFLMSKYQSTKKSFHAILEETIDEAYYLESDLKKTLKHMEKAQKIKVTRIDSKRDGIKGKDIIIFGS